MQSDKVICVSLDPSFYVSLMEYELSNLEKVRRDHKVNYLNDGKLN